MYVFSSVCHRWARAHDAALQHTYMMDEAGWSCASVEAQKAYIRPKAGRQLSGAASIIFPPWELNIRGLFSSLPVAQMVSAVALMFARLGSDTQRAGKQ